MRKPTFCFLIWSDTNQAVQPQKPDFGFRKKRDCTIYVAKTKALISYAVTAKLICVFVFAYAKCWFSHDAAHFASSEASDQPEHTSSLISFHCLHVGNLIIKVLELFCHLAALIK